MQAVHVDGSAAMRQETRDVLLGFLRRLGPLATDQLPYLERLSGTPVRQAMRDLIASGTVTLEWDPQVPGRRRIRLVEGGPAVTPELRIG